MNIRALGLAATIAMAASSLAAASADAEVFDFSYTFADGGVVSGVVEGVLDPDVGVSVNSVDSLVVFGQSIAQPLVAVSTLTLVPPAIVTFDGSFMDMVFADASFSYGIAVTSLFGPTEVTAGAPGIEDEEAFDPTRWSISAAVPEPSTWTLMLAGFGAASAVGYASRRRTA